METGMEFSGWDITGDRKGEELFRPGYEAMTHPGETGAAGRSRTDRKIEWGGDVGIPSGLKDSN